MEEENQFQQITAARKYIAEQALKQQTKKVRCVPALGLQTVMLHLIVPTMRTEAEKQDCILFCKQDMSSRL